MVRAGAERSGRILDAAAELIARYGYGKTSVSDIARTAGIAKGAVYQEFESKEAVLEALLARQTERLARAATEAVLADPEGGRLSAVYRHTLRALAADPLMRALYTADSRVLGDVVRGRGPDRYAPRQRWAVEFVARMQEAGLVRGDLDAAAVAHVLAVISTGLITVGSAVGSEAAPPLEATIEAIGALVAGGFEGDPSADPAEGRRAFTGLVTGVFPGSGTEPSAPSTGTEAGP
ncbi:TetR/AcrR family transcriptional regulator [Actinorugispora endophytica]|uniref:TetR family transcriptional regulator n=1 Tax=Actinorugispora endophytica TaxID=1605990 RepID=A0A4R6V041_9ACTN|nr:TetR/AcrR family transcriptional regulator [Actinorugispora endophytica]TDQ53104.1 TetR family transcriptional regulator [Actinorugispora endophytica]